MKKNVLVFPCGSEIGLAVYRSLNYSIHFNLLGGSSVEDHGGFVYANYIGNMPLVTDSDFGDKLNAVIDKHKIDFVIPAHDDVVLTLAQLSAAKRLNCAVITSPVATCQVTRSKLRTYRLFDGVIAIPKVYASPRDVAGGDLPVFLKPDIGQGSKETHIAGTMEELRFFTENEPSLLILEYLPGKEYTVDCFTNKNGQLLLSEGRERQRISNGISVRSVNVADKRFREIAQKINQRLELRGAWFFQVKEAVSGELVLMEIAPRVAGTIALIRCKGVNLPLLSLFDAMGYEVEIIMNDYALTIDRALQNRYKHNIKYSHVYLDFEDVLIIDNRVNPVVIAFVYQCLNQGVKVHLITKVKGDLNSALSKYRLSGVFDELIQIDRDDHKHSYIKEKDAIFIDDSFAERKMVHDKCGIPVFDCHMIEALLE